jgi:hypothetical protein
MLSSTGTSQSSVIMARNTGSQTESTLYWVLGQVALILATTAAAPPECSSQATWVSLVFWYMARICFETSIHPAPHCTTNSRSAALAGLMRPGARRPVAARPEPARAARVNVLRVIDDMTCFPCWRMSECDGPLKSRWFLPHD